MPCYKRDWKQYNKQLINRGNINFWVTKKSLKFWKAKKKKKAGRPFTYNDQSDADGTLQLPTSTKGTGRVLLVLKQSYGHPKSSLLHANLPQDAKHPAARRAHE